MLFIINLGDNMKLNDIEIKQTLAKIQQHLGENTLANELEMIVKHLPTYTKIIKTHIEQLQNVLASDNHHNKNLDNVNLSPTVKQLMNIFDKLQHDDLQKLEELHHTANTWQPESPNVISKNLVSEATL